MDRPDEDFDTIRGIINGLVLSFACYFLIALFIWTRVVFF